MTMSMFKAVKQELKFSRFNKVLLFLYNYDRSPSFENGFIKICMSYTYVHCTYST